jgi:hypothetical protein
MRGCQHERPNQPHVNTRRLSIIRSVVWHHPCSCSCCLGLLVMSNSRTRSINYKPRLTQLEAYDLLPVELKRVNQIGAQQWDTAFVYRKYKSALNKGVDEYVVIKDLVKLLMHWHTLECANGYPWRTRKVGQRWADTEQSPHNLAKCKDFL